MKRVLSTQLVPGMVAGEDIYSYNNQLLIPKNTVLTDTAITILEVYDIISIRIKDDSPSSPPTDYRLSYSERIKAGPAFKKFKKEYTSTVGHFQESMQNVIEKRTRLNTGALLGNVISLMNENGSSSSVFEMLQCMREYDNSTFAHCVNVSLICNVAAKWLNLSEEDIQTATSCGLFHDIGKLQIPQDILGKPAGLTPSEYNIIKKHPIEGYRLLQEQRVDKHICNAALMHHERCDGSGYPSGLHGAQIDYFAKLVSIADVYDAMTAARVYRGPLCPFTVIELFEREGLQKYEPKFIMTFLENVVNTYILNRCRLTNGQEGEIIYINKDNLSRPMVQCGEEYINLAERPELSIDCLL